jgi:uncharacterized protein YciI
MASANELKIAEMLKGMLNLKLFVIFSQGKGLDVKPYLAEHLQYMIELERQGKLFASGPLGNPSRADGMTIVRAADVEEVHQMAQRDPFVVNGIRTYTVQPWTVMEGSLTFTVNLSDKSSNLS